MNTRVLRGLTLCTALAATLTVAACTSTESNSASSPSSAETSIPATPFSQTIHDALPQKIRDAGELRTTSIVLPPYAYFGDDGSTLQGINLEMADQLESILGVKISLETSPTVADISTGFSSDRFDVSIAPMSDLASTEESFDFADWLAEFVVFLVQADNPKGIDSLDTACGTTIATLQGGTAEKVLREASDSCGTAGNDPITINTFADQNTAVLAVQSGRADAAFSSQIPLTYFAQTDENLALTGTNQTNGFPEFFIGAYVPKGSPLAQTMLDAFEAMKASGAYDAILEAHGIQANSLETFGINLATAGQ